MFIQIAPRVKVYVTESHLKFIREHAEGSFRSVDLRPEDMETAKQLADKAIFVRKKLDIDVQYALNKRIRFVRNGIKK